MSKLQPHIVGTPAHLYSSTDAHCIADAVPQPTDSSTNHKDTTPSPTAYIPAQLDRTPTPPSSPPPPQPARPQPKKKNAKRSQPVADGETDDVGPDSASSSKRPRLTGADEEAEDTEPTTIATPATKRPRQGGRAKQKPATQTTRTTRASRVNSECLFLCYPKAPC